MPKEESQIKRLSIALPADVAKMLEFLANSQGISQNEAIRKAIATESYFLQARQNGSKVLLQTEHNGTREVLFR